MKRLLPIAVLAGCGPSGADLNINYVLSNGPTQTCAPAESCDDIEMTCESVLLLRFVDPDDGDNVYAQQCTVIPAGRENLCALRQVALDDTMTIPTSRVEVQLAIFSRDKLPTHPETGDPICPARIDFGADGFPELVATQDMPALGGRAYTDGYDDEITIELGCTDRSELVCDNQNTVDISASVIDFDNRLLVGDVEAANMAVRVGEPRIQGTSWVLFASEMRDLALLDTSPEPAWHGENVDITFDDRACIQVLYDQPQATAALVCRNVEDGARLLDLTGVYVRQSTLLEVLAALGLSAFPEEGLVLGIVVDGLGTPLPNIEVTPTLGTVKYLSADRTGTNNVATTSAGIFMSRDAPLDAGWTLRNRITMQVIGSTPAVGGLVVGRLTVMIVQAEIVGS